jgi:hypothetical protein
MHPLDLIGLRVIKEGIGTWREVESMPVDAVMEAFHYSVFLSTYSETSHVLNQPEGIK